MSPITRRWQRDLNQAEATEFKRGDKVRLISEPDVVLRVREIDVYGRTDGTGKVLCFNNYGHGKWIAINELELV